MSAPDARSQALDLWRNGFERHRRGDLRGAVELYRRSIAICPGFVDTPMASQAPVDPAEMIRPEDCAEIVRMLLRLGPRARIPEVIVERVGS